MKTRGTTIVEATPRDTVWAIGLSAKNWKAQHRHHWRGVYISIFAFHVTFVFFSAGQNLLGEILTEVREELAVRQK